MGIREGEVRRLGVGRSHPEQGTDGLNPRFLKIRVEGQVVTSWASADGEAWHKLDRSYELSGYQHNVLGGFSWIRPAIVVKGEGEATVRQFTYRGL